MSETSSRRDVAASLTLLAATVAALVLANSPASDAYKDVLGTELTLPLGFTEITFTVKEWVKNLLMSVFFLLVGMEIKVEFREGALSSRDRAILPFFAAAGGVLAPALIFLAIAGRADPEYAQAWAIPAATDIAFAVGVLGLLGPRVPVALKAMLLAVAVIDDLVAIMVIAIFYTEDLSVGYAVASLAIIAGLALLNRVGIAALAPYLVLGAALSFAILGSGVNPTLAGVLTAAFIPLTASDGGSPLHRLAGYLYVPVLFVVMPVFAFANAGVTLRGLTLEDLVNPLTLGIALGLAVGKPVGITAASWLAVRSGVASLPAQTSWGQMWGVGFIAGIGFTMSLFIGSLAFGYGPTEDLVRLGVFSGSLVAGTIGASVLVLQSRSDRDERRSKGQLDPAPAPEDDDTVWTA